MQQKRISAEFLKMCILCLHCILISELASGYEINIIDDIDKFHNTIHSISLVFIFYETKKKISPDFHYLDLSKFKHKDFFINDLFSKNCCMHNAHHLERYSQLHEMYLQLYVRYFHGVKPPLQNVKSLNL